MLPMLKLEDGALAELEPLLAALAAGPVADWPGVGAGVGAVPEGPGLDPDGAGAGARVPVPPVVGAKGTTELLPGVVPGDDGGTGTLLCTRRYTIHVSHTKRH